ncbi:hypothetical protein [Phenylobacterium sp.]|uniref:hypothetical protein n=1 Tax=Phenylobacterium sp. TaxID=1871053 RepID=UPI002FCB7DE5
MAISFLALQPSFWGWSWCVASESTTCSVVKDGLGWIGAGFPHVLAYPLAMISRSLPVIFGVLVLIDLGLIAIAWKALPRRLTKFQVGAGITLWVALSVATVLASPYLMVWAWERAH